MMADRRRSKKTTRYLNHIDMFFRAAARRVSYDIETEANIAKRQCFLDSLVALTKLSTTRRRIS